MEGFILVYNTESRKNTTKLNHFLFGRLVHMKKDIYYYPGILENYLYRRLSNGCYFILKQNDAIFPTHSLYECHPVVMENTEMHFINSKQHWLDYAQKKGLKIKNLTE